MDDVFTIIPTFRNRKGLYQTLYSLTKVNGLPLNQIYVIDNGMGKENRRACENTYACRYLDMPDRNLHEMWNYATDVIGVEHGWKGKEWYVLYSNDDVTWGPGSIERLRARLRRTPSVMAVGANYDSRNSSAQFIHTEHICAGAYDGTGGFPGFGYLLRGSEGVRFPSELAWWGGDNWVLLVSHQKGMACGIEVEAKMVHQDGGSQSINDRSTGDVIQDLKETTQIDKHVLLDYILKQRCSQWRYRGGKFGNERTT